MPGTYRASLGCVPCPNGTFSLFGASSCVAAATNDGVSIAGESVLFQRLVPFNDGNPALIVLLGAAAPILISLGVCLFVALVSLLLFSPLHLLVVDLFSIKPQEDGLVRARPSPVGGVFSSVAVLCIIMIMVITVYQFLFSNTLLQTSVLPSTVPLIRNASLLPRATSPIKGGFNVPVLDDLSTGLAVSVTFMGPRCGVYNSTYSLFSGGFVKRSLSTDATNHHVHTFSSTTAIPDGKSFLTLTVDRSCQGFAINVAAIGVGGGLSVVSFVGHNVNTQILTSFEATVALGLEIVEDLTSDRGLIGRAAVGLVPMDVTNIVPTFAAISEYEGTLTISIALPLGQTYRAITLQSLQTPLSLLSALTAYMSLLGIFHAVYDFGRTIVKRLNKRIFPVSDNVAAPCVDTEADKSRTVPTDHIAQRAVLCDNAVADVVEPSDGVGEHACRITA
jgi:hypothetical protein